MSTLRRGRSRRRSRTLPAVYARCGAPHAAQVPRPRRLQSVERTASLQVAAQVPSCARSTSRATDT